jgi:hypothetical protein
VLADAVPAPELGAAVQAKLLKGVGDVIFDCIDTDALTGSDPWIAETVAYSLDDPPFGRGQQVSARRTAGSSRGGHASS